MCVALFTILLEQGMWNRSTFENLLSVIQTDVRTYPNGLIEFELQICLSIENMTSIASPSI